MKILPWPFHFILLGLIKTDLAFCYGKFTPMCKDIQAQPDMLYCRPNNRTMKKTGLVLLIVAGLFSCKDKNAPDVSNIKVELAVKRFEQDHLVTRV